MNLIDSHTHLYFKDSYETPSEVVQRSINSGVIHMIFPGVNFESIEPSKALHSLYPTNTSLAAGLHPTDIKADGWKDELGLIEKELRENRSDYAAVGETGVDLHWDNSLLDLQQQSFERQLKIAIELDLPVIIHSRDAFPQTYEVLSGIKNLPPIVFHSYSGDIDETERILSMFPGAFFGINGIVTFKNSRLKDVLTVIPDDKLLLETDSPYLAPTPKRGMTNESSFLIYTAEFVAKEKKMPVDDLAGMTTENAKRFFRL